MKAGIFAAGMGSRFQKAGWQEPKPLIKLKGRPIMAHVLENLFLSGLEKVEILLNEDPFFDAVEAYLLKHPKADHIQVWRKTTASSFESFCYMMNRLEKPPFLLTTVDTIFNHSELNDYLRIQAYPALCDMVLAVTNFIHDEKPLWVEIDDEDKIKAMGESVSSKEFITAGLYLILKDLRKAVAENNFPALRNFLQYFVENHGSVRAKRFQQVLDIDSPQDITLGEKIL